MIPFGHLAAHPRRVRGLVVWGRRRDEALKLVCPQVTPAPVESSGVP